MPQLFHIDLQHIAPETIERAAEALRAGKLVAFPTETVYGLGANALDAEAVGRIFTAKGRPSADPLIVHIASVDDLPTVARAVPPIVAELARAFWPGPLTIILPKQPVVPDAVTAGLETVAVRIPAHPVALALIRTAGVPVAAPSANRFGRTSPTTAQHVLHDLGDGVDIVLDGGEATIGVESTVLDLSTTPPRILRPGGLTREKLEALIGPVTVLGKRMKAEKGLPSPGLLAKHYAPRAEMLLFSGENAAPAMQTELAKNVQLGKKVGILSTNEDAAEFETAGAIVYRLGSRADLAKIARHLYAGLRSLDSQGVDVILACDFGAQGLGLAIRDRLTRAATKIIGAG